MTADQIIKGNNEIAKMCGVSVYPVKGTKEFKKWKGEACDFNWFELKYESDWNMLISAHNKSRELFMKLDKSIQKEFLESDNLIVERFGFVNFFSTLENQYTISSCWNKMVNFAKWYNSLKL